MVESTLKTWLRFRCYNTEETGVSITMETQPLVRKYSSLVNEINATSQPHTQSSPAGKWSNGARTIPNVENLCSSESSSIRNRHLLARLGGLGIADQAAPQRTCTTCRNITAPLIIDVYAKAAQEQNSPTTESPSEGYRRVIRKTSCIVEHDLQGRSDNHRIYLSVAATYCQPACCGRRTEHLTHRTEKGPD